MREILIENVKINFRTQENDSLNTEDKQLIVDNIWKNPCNLNNQFDTNSFNISEESKEENIQEFNKKNQIFSKYKYSENKFIAIFSALVVIYTLKNILGSYKDIHSCYEVWEGDQYFKSLEGVIILIEICFKIKLVYDQQTLRVNFSFLMSKFD